MPLTAEQQVVRSKHLTASRLAAALGFSPFATPADVQQVYLRGVEDDGGSDATEIGNDLEPALIKRAASSFKLSGLTTGAQHVAPNKIMAATMDGEGQAPNGQRVGIEAKTAGLLSPFFEGEEWGPNLSSEIPTCYLVQCAAQLVCSPEMERIIVSALIGGRGYAFFIIDRAADDIAQLLEQIEPLAVNWWQRHIVDQVPVMDTAVSLDVVKRIRRVPSKVIDLDAEGTLLVQEWQDANERLKAAKEAEEAAKAAMLMRLGDAEAARLTLDGQPKELRYLLQNGPGSIDREVLQARFPEAWSAAFTPSQHRVARIVKAK